MKILPIVFFYIVISFVGCTSTESTKNSTASSADTSKVPELPPTVVMKNMTRVTAVVESIEVIDDVRYTLSAFISAAEPVGSMTSLAQTGERLSLYPYYELDGSGLVDKNSVRNKPLMMLLNAKQGESFKAIVAQDKWGGWMIVAVEKP